jgi:hypothetical protein
MARQITKIKLNKFQTRVINLVKMGLAIVLVFGLAELGFSQEEKDKEKVKTTSVMKEVEGEVTWIGQNKIAILYRVDEAKGEEYEILLPLDEKDLTFVHKKNLGEIGKGDTVNVQYEEITEEGEEGRKTDRKAKVISFVKAGVKQPASAAEVEGVLPIKGVKGD